KCTLSFSGRGGGFGDRNGFGGGSERGSSRGRRGDSRSPRGSPRRGGGRGGGGGARGGKKVEIEAHRLEGISRTKIHFKKRRISGVFITRTNQDLLATRNLVVGESVYGEKRVSVGEGTEKIEYRIWNPFRSKLGAAILAGLDDPHIGPGTKLLYLGAASGTTVSHCSDIVGPDGVVYAVEFSHRSGRDLLNIAKKRPNIIPIVEDARHPLKYRMIVGLVDTIFSDVAQPDQARIVAMNAGYYLKNGGHAVMSI
ncbi:unnamed protein product, partial [Gongylonema pulchrum]|uniref:rRNA 2'-O-methyltransferase fibrillarin n=1 Tax=Gongylonema pulchrum TaxID=637853 RepID=A0A183EPF5_9BILA